MPKILYSAVYNGGFPFDTLLEDGGEVIPVVDPDEMTEFDSALVIWGGSDIHPELYGHPVATRCYPGARRRDAVEWALLKEAIDMEIPIFGVCRGAQMLCAAAGGFLLQDVNNHAGANHMVETVDGKRFKTNSIHHQMMAGLHNVPHQLLGWAEQTVGAPYIYRDDKVFAAPNDWKEPEFVYFPDIAGYAIQWHPEGMQLECDATQYVLDFIRQTETARLNKRHYVTGGKEVANEA